MNVCTKFPLSRYNEAKAWKMARFENDTDEAGAFENYSLSVIYTEKFARHVPEHLQTLQSITRKLD